VSDTKNESPKNDSSKNDLVERRVSLALLIVFAFTTVCGTLMLRHPEPHQELLLKICTALSAAAVAAIIPGVLEFQTKLHSSAIKATGAIAVFLFVCFAPWGGNSTQLGEIAGKWQYQAIPKGPDPGFSSLAYGGTATFDVYGKKMIATVDWGVNDKGECVSRSDKWETDDVALSSSRPDQLLYAYHTEDRNGLVRGFTSLSILRAKQGEILMHGYFQRTGPDIGVNGEVDMQRQTFDCKRIAREIKDRANGKLSADLPGRPSITNSTGTPLAPGHRPPLSSVAARQ
jgi:hypothetical protein